MKLSKSAKARRNRIIKTWALTNGYCVYCNQFTMFANRSVDHVLPASMGGTYHRDNMVPACKRCNNARANRLPATAFAHPHWKALVASKEK
jgi:5-methylcytosine-specific restriction endonuclease McrA